jgi:hypothetical protein
VFLIGGVVLTVVAFVLIRRRTRPWKIEYDAVGWTLAQAGRKRHPARARFHRLVGLILLCVPSAIAALVLFFYPVATHLVQPCSRYFRHYRVPIPWTAMVCPGWVQTPGYRRIDAVFSSSGKGRFGMTPLSVGPFWLEDQPVSLAIFVSDADSGSFDYSADMKAGRRGATEAVNREFRAGDVAITCLQYRPERPRHQRFWPEAWSVWRIDCETPAALHQRSFYASFSGREEEIGTFYQIIEGVRPVD